LSKLLKAVFIQLFNKNFLVAQNEQNIIQTKKLLDTIIDKFPKISNNELLEFGKNLLSKLQGRLYLELQVTQ
jgi:hypothetical protein